MDNDTKELIKKDVLFIAKLCNTHDCSKPETAKIIFNFTNEKSVFKSPVGKAFQQRMVSVAKGEINEDLCLLCRKNIAPNHAICPQCLNKINNLQAKQTINPTVINQGDTESSAVNKINASEIGKQAKEFTQNIGSTAQEISANVKNITNAAQKKILDEMNSESAQEIKRKAIAKAEDTSDNIKNAAIAAKTKWNGMSSPKKKRWKWVIGFLVGCYIISKVFGLDNSFNEDDGITLIGQNVTDTNQMFGEGKLYDAIKSVNYANGLAVNFDSEDTLKIINVVVESPYSGTLCNFSIGDTVDIVTNKMNELDAMMIEEKSAEGYTVEERGYRTYSFKYDGKSMICGVNFQAGLVTMITCNVK